MSVSVSWHVDVGPLEEILDHGNPYRLRLRSRPVLSYLDRMVQTRSRGQYLSGSNVTDLDFNVAMP